MRKGAVAWKGKVGMEGKWLIGKEFINRMGLHFSIFVRNGFEFTKVIFHYTERLERFRIVFFPLVFSLISFFPPSYFLLDRWSSAPRSSL